jgi:glycosyltransferase involved in cell wall biosynthesis
MTIYKSKDLSISVIVCAYNAEKTLDECLKAIRASVYKPLEIIVVNDASTDKTSHIARHYGVKLVTLEKNSGPGVARNIGSERASGSIPGQMAIWGHWPQAHE